MATALVTGASTGIGLATAVRLAADHDLVWAGARHPDGAEALVRAVAGTGNLHPLVLDVDDDASVEAAFARVADEGGPVDVLVNNAGVSSNGPIEETSLDEFRRQMETNYFGLLRCTQAVLPSMRERRSGVIVNVSSLSGRVVRGGMGAYGGTKFAVEAVSEALAQEMAPFGVGVVIIEPGVIRTPIWTKAETPAATAYPLLGEMTLAYYTRMLAEPTEPEVVAEAIADAVASGAPRLRVPVGWDAERIIAARPHVGDEDFVAMAGGDVETWKQRFGSAFGIDLG